MMQAYLFGSKESVEEWIDEEIENQHRDSGNPKHHAYLIRLEAQSI